MPMHKYANVADPAAQTEKFRFNEADAACHQDAEMAPLETCCVNTG